MDRKQRTTTLASESIIPHTSTRLTEAFHPTHTVYSAEMHAIRSALLYIQTQTMSFSLTHSPPYTPSKNSPIYRKLHAVYHSILDLHEALIKQQYNIAFTWIPSHVSILGNEIADNLGYTTTIRSPTTQLHIAHTYHARHR